MNKIKCLLAIPIILGIFFLQTNIVNASESNALEDLLHEKTKVLKLDVGGYADGVKSEAAITVLTPGLNSGASFFSNDGTNAESKDEILKFKKQV